MSPAVKGQPEAAIGVTRSRDNSRANEERSVSMGIPRLRSYGGPAVLSYGFRPFFLLGSFSPVSRSSLHSSMFRRRAPLVTTFAPRDWHVHEMLYGYLPA